MSNKIPEAPVSDQTLNDEVIDAEVLDHEPAGREIAALVAEMCTAVFAVVAEGSRTTVAARDRVLIPEVRVGGVIDVFRDLRPRLLVAAEGACGVGANRLKSLQDAIRSRIDRES